MPLCYLQSAKLCSYRYYHSGFKYQKSYCYHSSLNWPLTNGNVWRMKPCHTNRNYIWPILCLSVWCVGGGKNAGFWVQVTSFACQVLCSERWLAVEIQHQRYQSALLRSCQERQEKKGQWKIRIFSLMSSVEKKILKSQFQCLHKWQLRKTQSSIRKTNPGYLLKAA